MVTVEALTSLKGVGIEYSLHLILVIMIIATIHFLYQFILIVTIHFLYQLILQFTSCIELFHFNSSNYDHCYNSLTVPIHINSSTMIIVTIHFLFHIIT